MNNLKEKKLNNKGFSLVELIIVIAIMAVLIGVLAPQYLKYVERSRQSADLDNIDQIISAVEIYAAENGVAAGDIKSDTNGKITTTFTAAMTNAGLTNLPDMKSSAYKKAWTITVASDGTMTVSDATLAEALGRAPSTP